jgi:hypothetical protein
MCDPVSLTIGAAVITAGAQVYGGMAANAQGKYQQRIAEQNRTVELQARDDARARGEIEQMQHWRKVAHIYGEQRAKQTASGLDPTFGSAADLMTDVQLIGYEDSGALAENTVREMTGYETNAANYRMQGRAARSQGKAALVGGILQAGSTILSSASQVSKMSAASKNASI